jgi:uncharacterized protein (TIGR03435 family)
MYAMRNLMGMFIAVAVASAAPLQQIPKEKFEVVSIRPADAPATPAPRPCVTTIRLNAGRLEIRASVYRLVTLAYGMNCRAATEVGLVSGGPDWIHTQQFEFQATIPAGTPSYSQRQLQDGEAPQLQAMLQNLLVDRFNLKLRKSSKEAPIYDLVSVRPGKLKLSEDQSPIILPQRSLGIEMGSGPLILQARSMPMATLVYSLQGLDSRFVVDKTGMNGYYDADVRLSIAPDKGNPSAFWPLVIQDLGLKLQPTRGPVDVLFIDRIERPKEN